MKFKEEDCMDRVILPKKRSEIDDALIFLAGPISNAPLWQDKAIEILRGLDKSIYIASPHKSDVSSHNESDKDGIFLKQLDWEVEYLEKASKNGAILFWLPTAQSHDCKRSYARDTRGELGEWRGRLMHDKSIKIAIGGEDEFDGFDIIKRNFLRVKPDMKFYSTLEETCIQALKLARLSENTI
jgi:hypothetical protein